MRDLQSLGIEYLDRDRYVTRCPQCSDSRRKKGARSLCVWRYGDRIHFKCYHPGACVYNQTQSVDTHQKPYRTYTPIKQGNPMFLALPESQTPPIPQGSILYKYFEASEAKFYVCRTEDKRFIPFAWTNEGWVSKRPPVKSLYRSEFLDQPTESQYRLLRPVIVVEGEKAADAAALIFKSADVVSWVGGAANVNAGDWDLLKGRHVTIWPDNDEPGIEAANKIAKLIDSMNIYIVDTSELPPKADLADDIDKETIEKLYRGRKRVSAPMIRGLYDIKKLATDLNRRVEGLTFGFPEMDKYIRLPHSGIVIVEGRTNHGKSAFMINLTANLLQSTNAVVLYASYEIPAADTNLKLVKCLEGAQYSATSFENDKIYANRMKDNESKGYSELTDYVSNGRLYMTDEQITGDEVCKAMRHLKSMGVPVVVCLDYFQLIPSDNRLPRYLAIKQSMEMLRAEAHRLGVVVVGGSQLTIGDTPFSDTARESGDIHYCAELVLKVWNKEAALIKGACISKKTADGEKKIDYYDDVDGGIVINVMKTRQGGAGKKFGFNLVNGIRLEEVEVRVYQDKYDTAMYYK